MKKKKTQGTKFIIFWWAPEVSNPFLTVNALNSSSQMFQPSVMLLEAFWCCRVFWDCGFEEAPQRYSKGCWGYSFLVSDHRKKWDFIQAFWPTSRLSLSPPSPCVVYVVVHNTVCTCMLRPGKTLGVSLYCLFFFFFFETAPRYMAQAYLKSVFSCPNLPSAVVTGMCHYAQLSVRIVGSRIICCVSLLWSKEGPL